MERQNDKFPYKKTLYLQWYEAAIANLILFKHLKERLANHIYFLISDQGILLKATSSMYLRTAEDQIDRFFHAKIEQLQISASSDFYENILMDIKQQTQKLKDTRDCPYINLVYSQKLKNSCLALKKFGYAKPYENWQSCERERRGFCYLIVRPEHRWKEIANNVMALVKKRQVNSQKSQSKNNWTIEMNYEHFIWLYQNPYFQKLKQKVEVKQKRGESMVFVVFQQDASDFIDFDKSINNLQHKYCDQRPVISDKEETNLLTLSALQIEKITELIYHEYGLPNLVREIRCKGVKFLVVGEVDHFNSIMIPDLKLSLNQKEKISLREDIGKIKDQQLVGTLVKLGRRHDLVSYRQMNFVMVKFQLPLKNNVQAFIKHRIPSLPRYYYWIEHSKQLYLLRRFQQNKFRSALEHQPLQNQVFLINSLIQIIQELHKRGIFIGNNLSDNVFVEGLRVIIEPSEIGSKQEDNSKLVLLVRQWVKGLRNVELKSQFQKFSNPLDMVPAFQQYISQSYF